jgi:bifunctional non-homologous end joining protein LigD
VQRRDSIPLTYMVFDVLSIEDESVAAQPYSERRLILEDLHLDGPRWRTPEAFDDGTALWPAVCAHELEGSSPRLARGRYLRGERGWIKTKNRDYWRWEMEREGALKIRRGRKFV